MGLLDRVTFTTNDREVHNFKEMLTDTIDKGVHRGFSNISTQYKIDVTLINQRLETLEKGSKAQFRFKVISSAILLGIILFKANDPLQAVIDLVKVLIGIY